MNLHNHLNLLHMIKTLPSNLQNRGNNPMVTYQRGNVVNSEMLNYKETINSS